MATDTYGQLDKEFYTIVDDHDLVVRVIEYKAVNCPKDDGSGEMKIEQVPSKVHEFKVKRSTLSDSSEVFQRMLDPQARFREANDSTRVDVYEGDPAVMELWFKILHGVTDLSFTHNTFNLTRVWEVLITSHKYAFDPLLPASKAWFAGWYAAKQKKFNEYDDYRSLLFPLYTFDHARGFMNATKFLVYHARGHIEERKPTGIQQDYFRLDQRVIQQLNAAKGRLKTVLHRDLYNPIEKLLETHPCAEHGNQLYAYEKGLQRTGAWPIEKVQQDNSMHDMIIKLAEYEPGQHRVGGCPGCSFNAANKVAEAVGDIQKYFDGLCLDCMDNSKPKFGDSDDDYWRHSKRGFNWSYNCRVRHLQPTWYFSFMGRKEKQIAWRSKQRKNARAERNF